MADQNYSSLNNSAIQASSGTSNASANGDRIHYILSLIQTNYAPYHGYVSIGVCIVGSICSILVVAVLTRRHMISATSFLLAALAVSDLLTMLAYVPFALQFYCLYGVHLGRERNSRPWAYFCLFYANFSVTTHTISIWICVVLSAYRYRCVRQSTAAAGGGKSGGKSGGGRRSVYRRGAMAEESVTFSKLSLACVVTGSALILLPNYVSLGVRERFDLQLNLTIYEVVENADHPSLNAVNFWIHALLVKLLPCFLMSIFGGLLLIYVRQLHRKRLMIHQSAQSKHTLASDERNCEKRNLTNVTRVCLKQKSVKTEDLIGENKSALLGNIESDKSIRLSSLASRRGNSEAVQTVLTDKVSESVFTQVFVSTSTTTTGTSTKEPDEETPKVQCGITLGSGDQKQETTRDKLNSVDNSDKGVDDSSERQRRGKSFSVVNAASERAKTRKSDHQRTTGMLCAVLVLFLVTELPQGILALVCGLEPGYYPLYYAPLGDVMDIVALVNNAINFILYCATSRQFRSTFWSMIVCKISKRRN